MAPKAKKNAKAKAKAKAKAAAPKAQAVAEFHGPPSQYMIVFGSIEKCMKAGTQCLRFGPGPVSYQWKWSLLEEAFPGVAMSTIQHRCVETVCVNPLIVKASLIGSEVAYSGVHEMEEPYFYITAPLDEAQDVDVLAVDTPITAQTPTVMTWGNGILEVYELTIFQVPREFFQALVNSVP